MIALLCLGCLGVAVLASSGALWGAARVPLATRHSPSLRRLPLS